MNDQQIYNKFEDVFNRTFPDVEPLDELIPWMDKNKLKMADLDRAIKKNSRSKDYDSFMKTAHKELIGETTKMNYVKLIKESLTEKVFYEPEEKDNRRIDDIITKSKGSNSKAEALAIQMANSIDKVDKAWRRYMAAKNQGWNKLAKIFYNRYKELGGK